MSVGARRGPVLLLLVSTGWACSGGTMESRTTPTITHDANGVEIVEYGELPQQAT